jgi:hypothetical protein
VACGGRGVNAARSAAVRALGCVVRMDLGVLA